MKPLAILQERLGVQTVQMCVRYKIKNHKLGEDNMNVADGIGSMDSEVKSKVDELARELLSVKERNEEMGSELMEMQERYSEISLKFVEVEGERQNLLMTVRCSCRSCRSSSWSCRSCSFV